DWATCRAGQGGSMSEQRGDRSQDLFDQAVALPPDQRAAFLEAACAGDARLRAEVESLLACDAGFPEGVADEGVLKSPLVRSPVSDAGADFSFLAPPSEPGSLGRLDHYEVLEVVGRGSMGIILRARDTKLRRIVALKVLAAPLAATSTARQRFLRDARAAAAVRDDHVVALHAVRDDAAAPSPAT